VKTDSDLRFALFVDRHLAALLVRLLAPAAPPPGAPPREAEPRRILLVKFHGIGNIVMLLPSLRAVRRRFPAAEIDLLTFSSNRDVCAGLADVDRTRYLEGERLGSFVRSAAGLLPALRARRYDLVLDFEQFAMASALIAALTGAPRRIGFATPAGPRGRAFTLPVEYRESGHMSGIFLEIARGAGAAPAGAPVRLEPGEGGEERLRAWARGAGIGERDALVVLHPGSSPNLTLRRWPASRFAELGDRLAASCGVRIVVTGEEQERPLAESVARAMRPGSVVAAGALDFAAFAALCRRAALVVSNDTSAVHVASAVGTPVAGLYGPNTPFLYGPTGGSDLVFYHPLPCSPCLTNGNAKVSHCRRARCMEMISVDEVFSAVRGRLPEASLPPR
jgi:ADP-heptose:LPS heptosyltransferase